MSRPKVDLQGQKELDQVEQQIEKSVDLSLDRSVMNPKETEPQTKIAQSDLEKTSTIYLKPKRTFPSREKFNEKFRDEYNFQKEYIEFIAENNEVKGESIDLCIKKFPGMPVEEWIIPVNTPVSAPRYIKRRIEECGYTVFSMTDRKIDSDGAATYYGQLSIQEQRARLAVREVSKTKRINMGHRNFY